LKNIWIENHQTKQHFKVAFPGFSKGFNYNGVR